MPAMRASNAVVTLFPDGPTTFKSLVTCRNFSAKALRVTVSIAIHPECRYAAVLRATSWCCFCACAYVTSFCSADFGHFVLEGGVDFTLQRSFTLVLKGTPTNPGALTPAVIARLYAVLFLNVQDEKVAFFCACSLVMRGSRVA